MVLMQRPPMLSQPAGHGLASGGHRGALSELEGPASLVSACEAARIGAASGASLAEAGKVGDEGGATEGASALAPPHATRPVRRMKNRTLIQARP